MKYAISMPHLEQVTYSLTLAGMQLINISGVIAIHVLIRRTSRMQHINDIR